MLKGGAAGAGEVCVCVCGEAELCCRCYQEDLAEGDVGVGAFAEYTCADVEGYEPCSGWMMGEVEFDFVDGVFPARGKEDSLQIVEEFLDYRRTG